MTWPSTAAWRRTASSRARYAQAGASGWRASAESSRAIAPAARSRLAASGCGSAGVSVRSRIRIHERGQAVDGSYRHQEQFALPRDTEVISNSYRIGTTRASEMFSFDFQTHTTTGRICRIADTMQRFATAPNSG